MKDKIIDYVTQTPENTNVAVLNTLLEDSKEPSIDSADVARIVKNEFAGGVGYTETQVYSVTWDGDKTDKVSVANAYYKVSDLTPDISGLQKINIVLSNGDSFQDNADSIYKIPGECWLFNGGICVFEAGINVQGMVFPETGMYVVNHSGVYVSEVEYTLHNVKRISRDYIPSTPKFVVDATNLPTDVTGWHELYTALDDASKSGHDIFLDIYGDGSTKLKLTNRVDIYYLFLCPHSSNTIHAYILEAMPRDGGSLKKLSLTATEVSN